MPPRMRWLCLAASHSQTLTHMHTHTRMLLLEAMDLFNGNWNQSLLAPMLGNFRGSKSNHFQWIMCQIIVGDIGLSDCYQFHLSVFSRLVRDMFSLVEHKEYRQEVTASQRGKKHTSNSSKVTPKNHLGFELWYSVRQHELMSCCMWSLRPAIVGQ